MVFLDLRKDPFSTFVDFADRQCNGTLIQVDRLLQNRAMSMLGSYIMDIRAFNPIFGGGGQLST